MTIKFYTIYMHHDMRCIIVNDYNIYIQIDRQIDRQIGRQVDRSIEKSNGQN